MRTKLVKDYVYKPSDIRFSFTDIELTIKNTMSEDVKEIIKGFDLQEVQREQLNQFGHWLLLLCRLNSLSGIKIISEG